VAGHISTSLLNTAGISPDQYGAEILLDLPNNSVMLGGNRPDPGVPGSPIVDAYAIAAGSTLYAPKLGARSATSITRGSEPTSLTYSQISDTAGSFTKSAAYDAWSIPYTVVNDVPAERLAAELGGIRRQSAMAMGNSIDSSLLGLYSSAANAVGSSGVEFTIDNLAAAIKYLEVANAPKPYYAVLPSTQWDHLARTDELTRFDIRGEGGTLVNGTGFRFQGVDIYTTGNVPTASGAAHGLVFSRMGIRVAIRDNVMVREWEEPQAFAAMRGLVFLDFAYLNSFTDWIVDFATTDS